VIMNGEADFVQSARNDRKITEIGIFMRGRSINELPQFFNVLLGNMSVDGPRPHMLQHTVEYVELIGQYGPSSCTIR
jgi:putative colanic acid biosynthesis UDP-glucose lipid carrier transferase